MAINIRAIASLVNVFSGIAPKIKGWIFSDGKFQPVRAICLLLFFIVIAVSASYIGVEDTGVVIDMLDDVSDMLGYSE